MLISESEKNRILGLYRVNTKKDFVFDFVLTENNKYLIIMDQVFVSGGGGKTIGSIWENTHIFNEIIKESLGSINESINELISEIKWNKDLVSKWLKETNLLSEQEKGIWDNIKSGVSNIASKVGEKTLETAKTIFNKGVVPALRWIRRGVYTGVGLVIDVVLSILAAKSTAIVWFVIVLLDIYEIGTGDFDPQDPDRNQLPFFFLLTDMLGCIFTGAVAIGAKKAIPKIAKEGIEKGAPNLVKPFQTLDNNIPKLKNGLKNTANQLENKLGPKSTSVIGKIKGFIDNILTQLQQFIRKLFSKEGLKAGVTAAGVYAAGHAVGAGIGSIDKEGKVGKTVAAFDDKMRKITGKGDLNVSKEEGDAILQMANLN
jgi:hypothetical protein